MAYAVKTLADLKQSLSDRHDNGTVPTNTTILAKYVRLLNRGVEYCTDRMRIRDTQSVVVTSGVGTLPTGFILANSVFNSSNVALVMVDPEDATMHTGLVYWITGNQTSGFTLNVPTDGTYTVNYAFRPTWMSSNSDVCIVPDIEAPVAYAYAMLRKSESDPFEDSEASLQECDARIAEMNSAMSINDDAIGFTMDFESNTVPNWFQQL
jgi:hypothetical protein